VEERRRVERLRKDIGGHVLGANEVRDDDEHLVEALGGHLGELEVPGPGSPT